VVSLNFESHGTDTLLEYLQEDEEEARVVLQTSA
jgi:hypothetical protein